MRYCTRTGIRYSNNGEITTIEALNQTTPIQVVVSSDPTATYIALAVAIMTAIGLLINSIMQRKQLKTMHEQVHLMESEMKQRLRPWLGAVDTLRTVSVSVKGKQIAYKEYFPLSINEKKELNVESFIWQTKIKNYGALPAHKVRAYTELTYEILTQNSIDKTKLNQSYVTLLPNNEIPISLEMPAKVWNETGEGKGIFALIYCEYEYGIKETGNFGVIYRIEGDFVHVGESWSN